MKPTILAGIGVLFSVVSGSLPDFPGQLWIFIVLYIAIGTSISSAQLSPTDDIYKAVRKISKFKDISKADYKILLKTLNR
ncbi:MAG: hypothetical protein LBF58_04610 [Deltaproteobacteria bacterium]|jgi:hypothetical protein|nr:hypothetical protein [Deltaproteobacteria bacterium]